MRTKQTERKTQKGLPRATFGSSLQKRRSGATGILKVKIGKPRRNRIPSDDEEAPACWSDISPSIPSSPEVEQLVDKVNEEYTAPMAADSRLPSSSVIDWRNSSFAGPASGRSGVPPQSKASSHPTQPSQEPL